MSTLKQMLDDIDRDLKSQRTSRRPNKPNANNKSGYLGVSWNKEGRTWVSNIKIGQKKYWLGRFKSAELAHEAYCEAVKNPSAVVAKALERHTIVAPSKTKLRNEYRRRLTELREWYRSELKQLEESNL